MPDDFPRLPRTQVATSSIKSFLPCGSQYWLKCHECQVAIDRTNYSMQTCGLRVHDTCLSNHLKKCVTCKENGSDCKSICNVCNSDTCCVTHYKKENKAYPDLPHICRSCLSFTRASALNSTAKLRGAAAKNHMFQSFSPSAVVVQITANANSSNDVFPFVIPEQRQSADANAAATDSVETGSVSSWSVVSDRA
jgi:hypothetical protein